MDHYMSLILIIIIWVAVFTIIFILILSLILLTKLVYDEFFKKENKL